MSYQYICDINGYVFVSGDTRYSITSAGTTKDICVTCWTGLNVLDTLNQFFAPQGFSQLTVSKLTIS